MPSAKPAIRRLFLGQFARSVALVMLLLALIPLFGTGALAYSRGRALQREQVSALLAGAAQTQGRQLAERVRFGQKALAQRLSENGLTTKLNALLPGGTEKDPGGNATGDAFFDQLSNDPTLQSLYDHYVVLDPTGRILLSTRAEWQGEVFGEKNEIFSSENQGGSQIRLKLPPLFPDQTILLTAVPYQNQEGEQVATLVAIAGPEAVARLVREVSFYATRYAFVTASGQMAGMSSEDERLSLFAPGEEQRLALQKGLRGGSRAGAREMVGASGIPVIAAYTWVSALNAGWVAEISQAQAYSQFSATFSSVLIGLFIAALLATAAIWWASIRMMQPLINLTGIATRFTQGDWGKRAPAHRQDEVGLLAQAFNQMADEMTLLTHRLEEKVQERSRQLDTASLVAEIATTSLTLDHLVERTIRLVQERFRYPYAAIWLTDESGRYASIRGISSAPTVERKLAGLRQPLSPLQPLGWAIAHNQVKVSAAEHEPARADLLEETRSEAFFPFVAGDSRLGALHLQSSELAGFQDADIVELRNIANLVSPALRSFDLLEITQINLKETSLLYQASHEIAQATNTAQMVAIASRALEQTPYITAILLPSAGEIDVSSIVARADTGGETLPGRLPIDPSTIAAALQDRRSWVVSDLILADSNADLTLPEPLLSLPRRLGCESAAFIPAFRYGRLAAMLVLGRRDRSADRLGAFTDASLQPFVNLTELLATSLEKAGALASMEKRLAELQTLDIVSQAVSVESDLSSIYAAIHRQLEAVMGSVDFQIALYDSEQDLVEIPYAVEAGVQTRYPAAALGAGMLSIPIRSRQPLLADLVEAGMGWGAPHGSWLGVPLQVGGATIGAIVVQDHSQPNRFGEEEQRLLTTLASQVGAVVRNARLLEQTRLQAARERRLNDMVGRIRRSTDIQTILKTTASELSQALGARRARIEIQVEDTGNGHSTPPEENIRPPGN